MAADLKSDIHKDEESPFLEQSQRTPPHQSSRSRTTQYTTFFGLGLSLFLNLIWLMQSFNSQTTDNFCNAFTTLHRSPITDQIDIEYASTTFDGSFTHESIYTQLPSLALEQAWDDLGIRLRHTIIPEDQAEHYGLDPGHLKLKPEQGGGFPVLFEFHHHLHCLNLLRQTSWFNFAHYNATQKDGYQDGPEMVRKHVGHCINQLRQVIQCNPDMEVFGQVWVDEIDGPFVNFNASSHKCMNWDAIRRKAMDLQVSKGEKLWVRWREGDIRLPRIP